MKTDDFELVDLGEGRWSIRLPSDYEGSTQRIAYIHREFANGEERFRVDSHAPVPRDAPPFDPYYCSVSEAFEKFKLWLRSASPEYR
ncbi:hypothetical protein [Glaciihabitans sp. dw_435]|uniref:hypothetical protein n=1 Tax=Glaciihabitans sp. dw_435 TaxID=2720081 RepID=UPI001BD43316|nr:hypothetical protein [Glaciihabitans sp. dw_435]